MLRTLTLLGVTALACTRGSGSSIRNVPPPATGHAADIVASQIRLIDDDCRDATSRATTADVSRELDGLELRYLGTLDGRIRLATGRVEVGESSLGVTMCYRLDGSLAKATTEIDAVEHSMGDRNRQLEATVIRYFDAQGGLLQIAGTKKLSEVQSGKVLEDGPVTARDVAPDAETILASFDREVKLVMHAAQLGSAADATPAGS